MLRGKWGNSHGGRHHKHVDDWRRVRRGLQGPRLRSRAPRRHPVPLPAAAPHPPGHQSALSRVGARLDLVLRQARRAIRRLLPRVRRIPQTRPRDRELRGVPLCGPHRRQPLLGSVRKRHPLDRGKRCPRQEDLPASGTLPHRIRHHRPHTLPAAAGHPRHRSHALRLATEPAAAGRGAARGGHHRAARHRIRLDVRRIQRLLPRRRELRGTHPSARHLDLTGVLRLVDGCQPCAGMAAQGLPLHPAAGGGRALPQRVLVPDHDEAAAIAAGSLAQRIRGTGNLGAGADSWPVPLPSARGKVRADTLMTHTHLDTPTILVENVSKRFVLNYSFTLKDALISFIKRKPLTATFAALDDMSISIKEGESVALLGFNGSGKSTLLKLISGVLRPDAGKVLTRGRVAGLIEVGAGFHPDLTGRENVYLNAAILGMSKTEIDENYDEIVEFSGIEKFIDTEVRHYSSGMFLRLAFSVAIHTELDVLLVDEILAVGDEPFREKCVTKIKQLASEGKTLVVVSHDLDMVSDICERGIVVRKGKVEFDGEVSEAVAYLRGSE